MAIRGVNNMVDTTNHINYGNNNQNFNLNNKLSEEIL